MESHSEASDLIFSPRFESLVDLGCLDSDIDSYEEDGCFYEASLFKKQVSAQLLTHHCFALYTVVARYLLIVVTIVLHCISFVLQPLGHFLVVAFCLYVNFFFR